jgi:cell division septation protein DedD
MSNAKRDFDWGPPAETGSESFGEFWVYLFLGLLLIGGGWLLLSTSSREMPNTTTEEETASATPSLFSGSAAATVATAPRPGPTTGPVPISPRAQSEIMPRRFFMIQLGAYGDEEGAREAYQKLSTLGFKASISLPDEQFELYRLLMGPFNSEAEAESLARKLNELEFPCFVIESL